MLAPKLSKLVDRMVSANLVLRRADQHDRRRVLLFASAPRQAGPRRVGRRRGRGARSSSARSWGRTPSSSTTSCRGCRAASRRTCRWSPRALGRRDGVVDDAFAGRGRGRRGVGGARPACGCAGRATARRRWRGRPRRRGRARRTRSARPPRRRPVAGASRGAGAGCRRSRTGRPAMRRGAASRAGPRTSGCPAAHSRAAVSTSPRVRAASRSVSRGSRQTSATRTSTVGWWCDGPGVEVEHAAVEHGLRAQELLGEAAVLGRRAERAGRPGRRPATPHLAAEAAVPAVEPVPERRVDGERQQHGQPRLEAVDHGDGLVVGPDRDVDVAAAGELLGGGATEAAATSRGSGGRR